MNPPVPQRWVQALLLLIVVTPLAIAEESWPYLALSLLAVGAAAWTARRGTSAVIGPKVGHVFVIAAFVYLLIEYHGLQVIPVLALSHFMILVCACKLLQDQTLRDVVLVHVLLFLLLVVAAIVSSSLLFPIVLGMYLSIGLQNLVRCHLAGVAERVTGHNLQIGASAMSQPGTPRHYSLAAVSTSAAGLGVLIGTMMFLFFPRLDAGMFGRFEGRASGPTMTGFWPTLNLERAGRIHTSNRQTMIVEFSNEDGTPAAVGGTAPYFRGAVFEQYCCRAQRYSGAWEWRAAEPQEAGQREFAYRTSGPQGGTIFLLPAVDPEPEVPLILQRYYLQPTDHSYLFTCYPALEVRLKEDTEIRRDVYSEVLWMNRGPHAVMRYDVLSPAWISPWVARGLARERVGGAEPRVILPEEPLPREEELRDLVRVLDGRAGTVGPLTDPTHGERFADAVQKYLQSAPFTYTLDAPPARPGKEPIGEFLLEHHRGHCEYYASAMAILCQLRGIPARVVSGYHGGEYNSFGQYFVVRQKDAHSWVEVFIPGRDWVIFDPTPGDDRRDASGRRWLPGARRYLDYLQFQWANLVVTYDSSLRSKLFSKVENWLKRPVGRQQSVAGAVAAFVRELIWWRAALDLKDRLLYWAFTVMVVALVVLNGYLLAVTIGWIVRVSSGAWAALVGSGKAGEAEFYARFIRRLAALGLRRRPDQTPAEFAAEAVDRFPALQPATNLVKAYYEIAYGHRSLDAARQADIEAFLQSLKSSPPATSPASPAG